MFHALSHATTYQLAKIHHFVANLTVIFNDK